LCRQIREKILCGDLEIGTRLPFTRELAGSGSLIGPFHIARKWVSTQALYSGKLAPLNLQLGTK